MRRQAILLAILPFTDALSLANFQQINSLFLPITCQLAYDRQIPSCHVSDFNNGCSSACQSALISVASDVSDACSDVSVSSSTLLGIVLNGGVIQALCPTTTVQTTPAVAESSPAADSVTIPTSSPGVVVATTPSTSKLTKTSPSTRSASTTHFATAKTISSKSAESTNTDTPESTERSATAFSTTATAQSTPDSQGAEITSTNTKKEATKTSKTKATATTTKSGQDTDSQGSGGSGGGSPFDISSGGYRVQRESIFAFVVAAMGCILMAR